MTFLQLKQESGLIFTDVEDAKMEMSRRGIDLKAYLAHENESRDEYLTTVKQTVIQEANKWAFSKGFPTKAINASTMGRSITQLGYQNLTVNKKLSSSTNIKAWRDICILPFDEDESGRYRIDEKPPIPQKTPQELSGESKGIGYPPIPAHVRAHAHEERNRKASDAESRSSSENTASNLVSGDYLRSDTCPIPLMKNDIAKSSESPLSDAISDAISDRNSMKRESVTSDDMKDHGDMTSIAMNENPKFRTYVVLKDFAYNGHMYSAGLEFVVATDLGEYVSSGVLGLKEESP